MHNLFTIVGLQIPSHTRKGARRLAESERARVVRCAVRVVASFRLLSFTKAALVMAAGPIAERNQGIFDRLFTNCSTYLSNNLISAQLLHSFLFYQTFQVLYQN